MKNLLFAVSIILIVMFNCLEAKAQEFDDVEIQIEQVSESLFMLFGEGGNIGVSIGDDATFIVDDQFAPLTERIVEAISRITDRPVDFVINTHWHFDHTGGNENFGEKGALIVSHENSRERMTTDQLVELFDVNQQAYTPIGLPKVTFDESVTFHLNGERIDVFHLGPAHTDGDAIVYFRNSNVLHTGDVFVRYGLPFIDQPNGGSINGTIETVGRLAEITNDETVIIPGHGSVSTRHDLLDYHDMLISIRDRISDFIQQGYSYKEIVSANPTEDFNVGGLSPEAFIRIVYDSLLEDQ